VGPLDLSPLSARTLFDGIGELVASTMTRIMPPADPLKIRLLDCPLPTGVGECGNWGKIEGRRANTAPYPQRGG
jgi:hypothetical protein